VARASSPWATGKMPLPHSRIALILAPFVLVFISLSSRGERQVRSTILLALPCVVVIEYGNNIWIVETLPDSLFLRLIEISLSAVSFVLFEGFPNVVVFLALQKIGVSIRESSC
jgi:hypothetical protein